MNETREQADEAANARYERENLARLLPDHPLLRDEFIEYLKLQGQVRRHLILHPGLASMLAQFEQDHPDLAQQFRS